MMTLEAQIIAIVRHYCDTFECDVIHVADELGISETWLREITYAHFGLSPRELIEMARLEKAIMKLKTGEHSSVLFGRCGFGSLRTFHRACERCLGMTPAMVRNAFADSADREQLQKELNEKLWARMSGGGATRKKETPSKRHL